MPGLSFEASIAGAVGTNFSGRKAYFGAYSSYRAYLVYSYVPQGWSQEQTSVDQRLAKTEVTMSSVQARKDELAAKRARLAELKQKRAQRQTEFTNTRQSLNVSEVRDNYAIAHVNDAD